MRNVRTTLGYAWKLENLNKLKAIWHKIRNVWPQIVSNRMQDGHVNC